MAKTSPSTSPAAGADVIQRIPVDKIAPHPKNAREIFGGVDAIAASMKEAGINDTPIRVRVRPHKAGAYQLIYGEQRWRAAKKAKLTHLRAEVVEATDAEAIAMMLRENFARSDLHPIEEANAIQILLEQGRTHEEIAAEYGVSRQVIARRARLSALSAKWRKRLKADPDKEPIAGWPVRYLELVATLEPEAQDLLLATHARDHWDAFRDEHFRYQDLERVVANASHEIARAPWPLDDDVLLPAAGSCLACRKRSSCRPELFDTKELGEPTGDAKKPPKGDRCLDVACWNAKSVAQIKRRQAEVKKEHGKVVLIQGGHQRHATPGGDRSAEKKAGHEWEWVPAKKGEKGARIAITVSGPDRGKERWVKPRPSHSIPRVSSGAMSPGTPTPMSERKARLKKRRDTWVCEKVCEAIEARKRVPTVDELLGLAAACGTSPVRGTPVRVSNMSGLARSKKAAALWEVLRPELVSCCRPTYNPPTKMAAAIALVLAIDFGELVGLAASEIPTPKGWAKLNANGTPKKAAGKAKGNGAKKAGGKKPKAGKRSKARKAKTPRGRGPKKNPATKAKAAKARKGRK